MVRIFSTELLLPKNADHQRVNVDIPQVGDVSGWKCLSWVRNKPTWVEPTLFSSLRQHSELASYLILLKSPDWQTTVAVYPVSSLEADCSLISGIDLIAKSPIRAIVRRNVPGAEAKAGVIVGLACGAVEERNLIKSVVVAAKKQRNGRAQHTDWVDDLWSGLGVCTWESFRNPASFAERTRPNKDLLLSLVPPPSIPLKSYLIDDGWQTVKDRRLVSFEVWDGMHASLADVVQALKAKGVEQVGVWLTLQGYWAGIHPDSPLIKEYDCVAHHSAQGVARGGAVHPISPNEAADKQWLPSPQAAGRFWDDYLSSLKEAGIDYIKCDNQAHYDSISSPTAAETAAAMWSGMLKAVVKHFGSLDKVIMCMSHNARMLCGPGGLDFDRPSGMLYWRNSDDYALDYAQTHPDHVRKNVYMAALSTHLSLRPDVDMFASTPASAWPIYHALLRALSPGPILLSDTPRDKTDEGLLSKMTAKDPKGTTKVVKSDTAVQILPGRLFWDNVDGGETGPAVVGAVAFPQAQGAIIAAWNAHDPENKTTAIDTIKLRDIEDALGVGLDESGDIMNGSWDHQNPQLDSEYAIWSVGLSSRNGQRVELVQPGGKLEFGLELRTGECESLVVAKVLEVEGRKVAVLGMLNKFACLAGLAVSVEKGNIVIKQRYLTPVSLLVLGSAERVTAVIGGTAVQSTVIEQTSEGFHLVTIPVDSAVSRQTEGTWIETCVSLA